MRQLAGPSDTLSGGSSGEGGGGGGSYQALIEADLLRFTKWRPDWEFGGSERRNMCQGTGAHPIVPKSLTRSTCT